MALVGRLGESAQAIAPLQNSQTPATVQSVLDQQPYIKDTFVNRTAFNPNTYAEEFQLLQQWTRGSRIEVTYFLNSAPIGGLQRSDAIDPSRVRSPVEQSYTQINKFVICVQDNGMQTSFDPNSTESKLIGTALLYPGMQPRVGDMFVTPIGDSKFGVFQVSSVDRLTYRQGSNHKIQFFIREFATDDGIADIKACVTKEMWFDTATYLGDGTTLLSADSYYYLKTLRQMRPLLIRYYYNTFYDKSMASIIGPNDVYDPYLVNYLNSAISISESIWRPTQLFAAFENYENSLWSRLTEVGNRKLTNIAANWNLVRYRATRWDVGITSLLNHTMVRLESPSRQALLTANNPDNEGWLVRPPGFMPGDLTLPIPPIQYISTTEGYVLSTNFYTSNKPLMTPFEVLVYCVIYDRKIHDIRDFIESYLNQYANLSTGDMYYFIPLYIWLIDVAIGQISAPSSFMT